MAYSAVVVESFAIGNTTMRQSNTLSSSNATIVSETIGIGTDTLVNIAIDVSAVKAFYICGDADCTIETNNSGAPDNTLSLKAGIPYIWYTNKYDTFKLTIDVTKIYVTNAAQVTLDILVLQDSTP